MAHPSFPPEIWDRILDNLWDDKCTTAACSLTCSAWLPTSRLHLFQTFQLYRHHRVSLPQSQSLNAILTSGSMCKIGSMAAYVRHLDVRISADADKQRLETLYYFTNVFELTVHVPSECDEEIIDMFKLLPSVKSLHLHSWMIDNHSLFVALLAAFPALSSITLFRVIVLPKPTAQPCCLETIDLVAPLSNRRLARAVFDSSPIYRWPAIISNIYPFLGPPWFSNYPPRLEFLLSGRAIGHRGDEKKLDNILRAAGASLEHLTLTLWEPTSTSGFFMGYAVTAGASQRWSGCM